MERASRVGIAVHIPVAETALEVSVVEHEDTERYDQHDHDYDREAAADEDRRQRGAGTGRCLGAQRPPGCPIPVLKTVVGEPPTLSILLRHESIMKGRPVGTSPVRAREVRT
jgi:hypothetical protein